MNEKSLKIDNIYCFANTFDMQNMWMFYWEYAYTYLFRSEFDVEVFRKFIIKS